MFRYLVIFFIGLRWAAAGGEELRDPTRPPMGFEVEADDPGQAQASIPKLTGIRIGKGGRLAVMDGKTATLGDVVGGYEVVGITRDRVRLRRNGGDFDVSMLPNIKKEKRKGQ